MTSDRHLTITLDNVEYTVEISGNSFSINGHPLTVGLEKDGSVAVDGILYDVVLTEDIATVDGVAHQVRIGGLNNRPSAGPSSPTASAEAEGEVRAIMPGTIVSVPVSEGDEVAEDDILVVLEAMKMENELRAPASGRVGAVFVRPGQIVEMNAVLLRIDSSHGT